jgi:DNA polymerase
VGVRKKEISMHLNYKEILDEIKSRLELELEAGIRDFISMPDEKGTQDSSSNNKREALASLRQQALECKGCNLYKGRRNLVFGSGSPDSRLVFVGEAPGREEDIQGLPFVGRAGQLLTKMIEAIKLKREEVYIANVLKCRPPENRAPLPDEVTACEHYLKEQLKIIKPAVICALGKYASQTLLKITEPITKIRGVFREYEGIKLLPTFHPAYLLRNQGDKKLAWQDLLKIKKELNSQK